MLFLCNFACEIWGLFLPYKLLCSLLFAVPVLWTYQCRLVHFLFYLQHTDAFYSSYTKQDTANISSHDLYSDTSILEIVRKSIEIYLVKKPKSFGYIPAITCSQLENIPTFVVQKFPKKRKLPQKTRNSPYKLKVTLVVNRINKKMEGLPLWNMS